jgi:hypothetical protein
MTRRTHPTFKVSGTITGRFPEMTLTSRLALLTARLEMEGRYTDANITFEALVTLCGSERLALSKIPAEDSCKQEEKM